MKNRTEVLVEHISLAVSFKKFANANKRAQMKKRTSQKKNAFEEKGINIEKCFEILEHNSEKMIDNKKPELLATNIFPSRNCSWRGDRAFSVPIK